MSMYKTTVNWHATAFALALGVTSIFVTPQSAAAQGPTGSYRNSCRAITMTRGGYLQAECRTPTGRWLNSRIRVSECRGRDIANRNGRLVCVDNRRGKNDGRYDRGTWDKGRHDDRDKRRDRNDRGWDPRNGKSGIVLFNGTQWRGRSMRVEYAHSNLVNTGFNDAVGSIRIIGRGTWRLCAHKNYGGRCVNVSSDVRDLRSIGLQNALSSVRRIR
jgi:hypothetical protein